MNRYPTDEELNAFIRQLEQQELYAPKNLKRQILDKKRRREAAVPMPVHGFAYKIKVVAGMAAALLMLVLLPMNETGAAGAERMAIREQKQTEAYRDWEEALQKEVAIKEKREAALQAGKEAAEAKIADMFQGLNIFGKMETEEN